MSNELERLREMVDRVVLKGGIVPWLMPEWGKEKKWLIKGKDVREWRRVGLGFLIEGDEDDDEYD